MNQRKLTYAMMFACTAGIMGSCTGKPGYPKPPVSDTTDDYFGHEVADPYRPLENDTAAATLAWVEAENAVTQDYLSRIPYRGALKERLTQLNDYVKTGLPSKAKDGRYYYFENDGLQNQSILYRTDKLGGEPEVFLDPNKLSDNGTVALTGIFRSPDATLTAYSISRNGSDWTEFYVMDTETKQLLADHVEWAKFSGAEWDDTGFYYSAYPRPEAGKEFSNANEYHRVMYHRLGTNQDEDVVVFEDLDAPLHFHRAWLPESNDYLFVTASGEGQGQALFFKSLKTPDAKWVTVEPSQDYDIEPVEMVNGRLYVLTNYGAPRNRLMAIDPAKPAKENWTEVIPEQPGVLTGIEMAGDKMIARMEQDASSKAALYTTDGTKIRDIEFPTYGSASWSAKKGQDEVFYQFSSFTVPSAIYSYNMADGTSTLIKQPEIKGFDPDAYVTEQVFYTSADGTKVPMFLTYKKGLERNGKNPVYLYGYGGFNISLNPTFSPQRLLWLENGGIYAMANLRGGSEYGEEWHLAGTKLNKMNVFNDFIAAAEYMINEKWTDTEHLAINGGSNGGLLVGATVNLRPDLFKVAVPAVGVMDMMRYHLFTIGWNWASDYGTSADSPEMAEYLLSYSPVHTIRNDGTTYPAIMVTTADHDDRVVPAHSFKYAAALQAANTGDAPKLIRIDSNAGHGAGKPVSKVIDEYADVYSFMFHNIGVTPQTSIDLAAEK